MKPRLTLAAAAATAILAAAPALADEKTAVLRVSLKPKAAPRRELMTFSFPQTTASTATLAPEWEKVRLSIPIEVDTPKIARPGAKEAAAPAKAADWPTPLQASRWA